MLKTFERGVLLGLGALSLTREKAQQLVDELEQRGRTDSQHARGWVHQLTARGEAERARLGNVVQKEIDGTVKRAGLARAREVAALNKRLTALEREAKKAQGPAPTPEAT